MPPVRIVIVGAGSRGTTYARLSRSVSVPAEVVGVAEPREAYRERVVRDHDIADDAVFHDWRRAAELPRFADAVVVATQDAMHVEPVEAFASLGYHVLLEKPMAPNADDCRRVVAAAQHNGILLAVCHVARYTNYTRRLKELLDSGRLGEVVSVQRLEPVGFWHMAHSFVRGNWRSEAVSSPMLLAKSCHDLDWIRYVVGRPCVQVSSFGRLTHFTSASKPDGAGERCLDCAAEPGCAYSAPRIYLGFYRAGSRGWPLDVVTPDVTEENLLEALKAGPYGRCVYDCDNDVVDHQVVNMAFEGGATASFTMTAFTRARPRDDRIFCTRAEVTGDGRHLDVFDFLTQQTERIDTHDGAPMSGHGGGDLGVLDAFLRAVATGDASHILSDPSETLETHLMVFAAERARREGRVVDVVGA